MGTLLHDRINNLSITNRLRFGKNAKMTIEKTDGSAASVSLDELEKLDTAGQVAILTATKTVLASESGKTFILNSATEFATTLPAPAIGLRYRFIVSAAPVGAAYTVVTNGGDNLIDGSATVAGIVIPAANEDTITFTASAALSGDWVELISDGTNWFVSGQAAASTGIAFTAT
jgi:hypothetical protein